MLFALRDLRTIEAERVTEERRAEEALRREQERARAAEDERRRAELEQRVRVEAERLAERAEHERDRAALVTANARSEQLEADIRALRSMMSPAAQTQPAARWPWLVVAAVVAAGLLGAPLLASRRAVVHPAAIEVAAPLTAPISAEQPRPPVSASPGVLVQPTAPAPTKARHSPAKHEKKAPRRAVLPSGPACDENDPLCGAGLD